MVTAEAAAAPGNFFFIVVGYLTIVLVATGTWQTEAPFGDHKNSLLAPEHMFKLWVRGFHFRSAISPFCTKIELRDISTKSHIQTQFGDV